MAAKNVKPEVQITDIDIERRARLFVAYSEYTRWLLSFPKRRSYTFTGATVIPAEAMRNIGLAFATNPDTKERSFGLCFCTNEYEFLSEIGIYTAYWEGDGITLILNSNIMSLTSIPFIRIHFDVVNHNQRKQMQQYSKMFLMEIVPKGRVRNSSGFMPTRLYPELIEVKKDSSEYSQPKNRIINRVLG